MVGGYGVPTCGGKGCQRSVMTDESSGIAEEIGNSPHPKKRSGSSMCCGSVMTR